MRTLSSRTLAPAIALVVLASGCGGSGSEFPATVPVSGKVTHKGEPVTKGSITFLSESGHTAVGELGPDGTYTLSSFGQGDGAVPGRHRVVVVATDAPVNMMPGSTPGYKPPEDLVPKKYNKPETSGLQAEVSADKSAYDFDLP